MKNFEDLNLKQILTNRKLLAELLLKIDDDENEKQNDFQPGNNYNAQNNYAAFASNGYNQNQSWQSGYNQNGFYQNQNSSTQNRYNQSSQNGYGQNQYNQNQFGYNQNGQMQNSFSQNQLNQNNDDCKFFGYQKNWKIKREWGIEQINDNENENINKGNDLKNLLFSKVSSSNVNATVKAEPLKQSQTKPLNETTLTPPTRLNRSKQLEDNEIEKQIMSAFGDEENKQSKTQIDINNLSDDINEEEVNLIKKLIKQGELNGEVFDDIKNEFNGIEVFKVEKETKNKVNDNLEKNNIEPKKESLNETSNSEKSTEIKNQNSDEIAEIEFQNNVDNQEINSLLFGDDGENNEENNLISNDETSKENSTIEEEFKLTEGDSPFYALTEFQKNEIASYDDLMVDFNYKSTAEKAKEDKRVNLWAPALTLVAVAGISVLANVANLLPTSNLNNSFSAGINFQDYGWFQTIAGWFGLGRPAVVVEDFAPQIISTNVKTEGNKTFYEGIYLPFITGGINGIVSEVDTTPHRFVSIKSPDGRMFKFINIDKLAVNKGDAVTFSTIIGEAVIGSTVVVEIIG
jgi:hypothetical protein